ncbi:dicarboxylate/amino acid:cation symporter [Clostridium sp.]|uniref:dicarboxylate/amino acid:cation symporter n=1 Tax=Clostridium sp. TaxID=1506 RepID=UPI002580E26D|nr:dicarboxylate/amino acid:cation symporter [Clostridium sp.]MBS5463503.1 dicarboxylate/amino acid:cation symporter [Clostridium sp.]MDR4025077.1 dicarboxylate/amino acid:cation symporter [Clostridium sp.]
MKEKKKLSLATKTFIGFGLGIVIGLVFGEKATIVKPLGTIFLNMIKMIVVPMVFFSITAGVASLGDLKKLRNIGVKVVGLYALTSALCVGLGLIMANIINPGKGFDLTALSQSTDYEAQAMPSIIDTLIDMFPSNIFTSFTNTNMLQIIVFSVFLGVALIMMGKEGERLLAGVQGCANAMYKITAIVMEFSPIGVCALLADSVGAYGLKIFGPLGKLILTVYASDVILVLLMYIPMVAFLAKFPVKKWLQGIWKVWVVTASTTSSSGSLPITTSVTNDEFGVSSELSSFSLPLGATINMNGGCIYYAAAIVMTAQIYGMNLTPSALVNIIISTVLVAMGCPGVPGGAIIMTTILLTNMGLPLEIVGLIAGIFRLIDMANTTFNVTGDVVTTMVVARSEGMMHTLGTGAETETKAA